MKLLLADQRAGRIVSGASLDRAGFGRARDAHFLTLGQPVGEDLQSTRAGFNPFDLAQGL